MIKMSIGAAFSETFAFLKANWMQMLLWVGGALVVVGLLGFLFLGSTFTAMAMSPGDPSAAFGALGKIFLFALIASVILYGVCMLIWRGGMHPGEAPNFAWAFQARPAFAFGMFVVMIAAYIVIIVIMLILGLIFGAALGGMGSMSPDALASGAVGGGAIFVMVILYIAVLVLMLWDGRSPDAQSGHRLRRILADHRGVAMEDCRVLPALHAGVVRLYFRRQHDLWWHPRRDPWWFGGRRGRDDDRDGGGRLPADHDVFILDASGHLPCDCAARVGRRFRLIA